MDKRDDRTAPPAADTATPKLDRAEILAHLAALIASDPTISGITHIYPSGEIEYIDASVLRRGGKA